jgi:hypothetical protein
LEQCRAAFNRRFFHHSELAQVVPVLRALHVYRKRAPAGMNDFNCKVDEAATCDLGNATTEVWLDHMDELATIPHRAFHSAFQEGDIDGMLGMKPWTTIHEGISRGSPHTFNLLFVFGGMQMTTVNESTAGVLSMDGEACANSNQLVLNAFRESSASPSGSVHFEAVQQQRKILVISRNGTWWRRWLNEKV